MKFGKVWSEELELSYFEHLLGGAGMDLVGAESPRTIWSSNHAATSEIGRYRT